MKKQRRAKRDRKREVGKSLCFLRRHLPVINMHPGEGVHVALREMADRVVYHYRNLFFCPDSPRAFAEIARWVSRKAGGDPIMGHALCDQLRARLVVGLVRSASRLGPDQGVYSWLDPEDRSITIRLGSCLRRFTKDGAVFIPRSQVDRAPDDRPLAYTSHFLDRWRERVIGPGEVYRGSIGAWDLFGCPYFPGLAMRTRPVGGTGLRAVEVSWPSYLAPDEYRGGPPKGRVWVTVGYAPVAEYEGHDLLITLLYNGMRGTPSDPGYRIPEEELEHTSIWSLLRLEGEPLAGVTGLWSLPDPPPIPKSRARGRQSHPARLAG